MLSFLTNPLLSKTSLTHFHHVISPPLHSPGATSNLRPKMLTMVAQSQEKRIILGCGGVVVDLLAAVDSYPKPDDKIRSTSFQVQGGGNAGNALTCAARLGLNPRLISKVANDPQGRGILEELEADGVDSSFIIVAPDGNSPFTYIIVDKETKTRTCIHTPGYPPLVPEVLSPSKLDSALNGARLVYFDVRLHETALVVAKEAARRNISILIDCEKKRDGLDELLSFATYVVCSAKFPPVWTGESSVPSALVSMLLRLPNVKFVIVTLGEDGCVMLERSATEDPALKEMAIDEVLESLKEMAPYDSATPSSVSSSELKLKADGLGTLCGRLHVGTAEKIPPSELVDTTGAGDAFIGAILYAMYTNMPPEKMLPLAAQVAGCACRALGARAGLPLHSDPRLAPFLLERSEIAA